MWTLILFSCILIQGVCDIPYSHQISGFSTKENCIAAGTKFVNDNIKTDFYHPKWGTGKQTSTAKNLSIAYNCVEVK